MNEIVVIKLSTLNKSCAWSFERSVFPEKILLFRVLFKYVEARETVDTISCYKYIKILFTGAIYNKLYFSRFKIILWVIVNKCWLLKVRWYFGGQASLLHCVLLKGNMQSTPLNYTLWKLGNCALVHTNLVILTPS